MSSKINHLLETFQGYLVISGSQGISRTRQRVGWMPLFDIILS